MKKAKHVLTLESPTRAHEKVYHLDPPIKYEEYDDKGETVQMETEYVVISGVVAMFSGPETYVFPSDKDGNIRNWGELYGSFRGSIDHEKALINMGYTECA